MQFKKHAEVVSSDGEKIGTLDRVVIDPKTREVAYLVVRSGLLLPEDKLIPVGLLHSVEENRIEVKASRNDLNQLLRYDDQHYIPAEHWRDSVDDVDTYYWYPPAFGLHSMGQYPAFSAIPVTSRPDINPDPTMKQTPPVESVRPAMDKDVPSNMVELKEGAKVIARDDKDVGHIERLLVDQETDRVTHLVLSRGMLLKQSKLVPAYWLTDVHDNEVHLAVDSDFLSKLPDYHP